MNDALKVLVIGAGPAGMMAGGTAAQMGCSVTVIDKNKRVGRKLMITGKGRCNITNNCSVSSFISSVPTNGKFLYSAINNFTPQDTIDFFEKSGLKVKTERGNRVFPQSDKAVDVVDAMHNFIKNNGCKIRCEQASRLIIENKTVLGAELADGGKIFADRVVIACGGRSYPLTGSTGDGYLLASQAGHTIINPKPSLVPLVSEDTFCAEMQGLSLKNTAIEVIDNDSDKIIYKDFGEMLFTHFGISGPLILSASAHMKEMRENKYTVKINLKPALSYEQLDKRIKRDFSENLNKSISNTLTKLLPTKMIPVIIELTGIDPDIKCNSVTREQRKRLAEILQDLKIRIKGFRPIEEAIITSGGVSVDEINPKTMESKLTKNLFFAGEVIDVDAYTGGFNLQIAYCTGYTAGINVI